MSINGNDAAPDTLRDVLENGGGSDSGSSGSCGDDNINSWSPDCLVRVAKFLIEVISLDSEVSDDALLWLDEVSNELPRSSARRLRSFDGRTLLLVVELETTRSCS